MSKTKNSGPAFPGERLVYRAGYETMEREPVEGMSLRDYFAAKTLQGAISSNDVIISAMRVAEERSLQVQDAVAAMCYEYADAMLKARI
jgi:hypothetical protein